MAWKRYRIIDLLILLILMCALEVLSLRLLGTSNQIFVLSLVMPIALIAYMRWNAFGVIYALVGGAINVILINAFDGGFYLTTHWQQLVAYTLGNSASIIVLLYFRKGLEAKEKLRKSIPLIIAYVATSFLAVCLFRSVLGSVLQSANFFDLLLSHLTRETFNFIFTLLVIIVTSKQDQVFADQKDYFETHNVRR